MELDYTIESNKGFDETVAAVQRETEAGGFRVQFVHDVTATLAEKGFERERLTILEMCNARYAHAVLAADVKIGLMLPCPVMVYAQGDVVKVSTMRPALIASFFPQADLGEIPGEVETALRGITERAAA